MKKYFCLGLLVIMTIPSIAFSQKYRDTDGKIKIATVKMPYSGFPAIWHSFKLGLELSKGPEALEKGGLTDVLESLGCRIGKTLSVELSPEEQKEFGVRNRLGIANGHLGKIVAANERENYFTVALQANDPSALGILAGLQHSGPGKRPLRVGMVWFDAHGDFNTPETSLSGMIGGMPVAIAAGLCLTRLRLQSGLDPALPTKYIVLAGVLDTDPLEQELIDRSNIEMISTQDIKTLSENIHYQMKRLSQMTDIIYVHVDLIDIVDQKDNPAIEFTFPEGPVSSEVAAALELIYTYEKAAVLGIASYPIGQDPKNMFLKAAFNIIEGAIKGLKSRQKSRQY